ncbi:MAG: transporter ATP-binding protein [bacterium]|jgi:ABC-type bacteriocin/lantibiotic exporter with double-glycine peptidase domain|nr:transporter ATP-binding protein [bacterium]
MSPAMTFLFRFFGHRRTAYLAADLFASAVLDLLGVIVLFPFIKLVTDPAATVAEYRLQPLLSLLHVSDLHRFVLLTSAGLILFYTVKAAAAYLLTRYQFKSTADLTYRLTEEMYARLLRCRYSAFQQFPASQLMGVAYNNPIHATICLTSIATIANDALFVFLLLIFSLVASPMATLLAVALLLVSGAVLQLSVVRRTQRYGKQQSSVEDAKHKLAFATLTAIKDIKVMGIEEHIREENHAISDQFFSTTWRFNLLSSVPKTAIEYAILTGLCLGILAFVGLKQDPARLIPIVGVGIAAVLRVLPSFTRIIASLNAYKFYRPFIDKITDFYRKTEAFEVEVVDCPAAFESSLEAKDICFSYDERPILVNVSMVIPKGQSIGIVGMSGSGKSTLLDLLSGIQEKASGEFLLDGQPVDPFHTNAIRRLLGYVPQTIALVDESIAFNVSFSRTWDDERLQRALRVANLLEFVEKLPERERTAVGENGIRLSGGQRQRIGIARALYKDPEILIFDEATSAVDNITEQELTREIRRLAGSKTLIIVAHRLSSIQQCDRIYVIDGGRIVGAGNYQDLLTDNALFQQLHKQRAAEPEPASG